MDMDLAGKYYRFTFGLMPTLFAAPLLPEGIKILPLVTVLPQHRQQRLLEDVEGLILNVIPSLNVSIS